MALTSVVAPALISRLGTRTAVAAGLLCTSAFTLAFGLAPDLCGEELESSAISRWLFLAFYFLNGLTGSTAETSCLITLTKHFHERIGTVMAAVGTVSGVGCMLGPMVGGLLYAAPAGSPRWAFRAPFLACASLPLLILPALPSFMPQVRPPPPRSIPLHAPPRAAAMKTVCVHRTNLSASAPPH